MARTLGAATIEACSQGGVEFEFGIDQNLSGSLDDAEVEGVYSVCHGEPGEDGRSCYATPLDDGALEIQCPGQLPRIIPAGQPGASGEDGAEGPAGPVGKVGPAGPAGPSGADGQAGPSGADGKDGLAGQDGMSWVVVTDQEPSGDNCAAGGMRVATGFDLDANGVLEQHELDSSRFICHGVDGEQGHVGDAGPQGEAGAQGDPGATGPPGAQGAVGPMGPQGPEGATGPQGLKGPAGPQGPQGAQGVAGQTGDSGAAGPQGLPGLTGKTGAQGPAGPKGAPGPQGAKGEAGAQGPQGAPGDPATDTRLSEQDVEGYVTNDALALAAGTTVGGHAVVTGSSVRVVDGFLEVNAGGSWLRLPTCPSPQISAGGSATSYNASWPLAGTPLFAGFTGLWTVVSGAGGELEHPDRPDAVFTGQSNESYVLRWTQHNAVCGQSFSADVELTFAELGITAQGAVAESSNYDGRVFDDSGASIDPEHYLDLVAPWSAAFQWPTDALAVGADGCRVWTAPDGMQVSDGLTGVSYTQVQITVCGAKDMAGSYVSIRGGAQQGPASFEISGSAPDNLGLDGMSPAEAFAALRQSGAEVHAEHRLGVGVSAERAL